MCAAGTGGGNRVGQSGGGTTGQQKAPPPLRGWGRCVLVARVYLASFAYGEQLLGRPLGGYDRTEGETRGRMPEICKTVSAVSRLAWGVSERLRFLDSGCLK